MVSDADLISCLREFLRSSDLRKTTNSIVRRKLEHDFSVDLSARKPFIREQVDLYFYNCVDEEKRSSCYDGGRDVGGRRAAGAARDDESGEGSEEETESDENGGGRSYEDEPKGAGGGERSRRVAAVKGEARGGGGSRANGSNGGSRGSSKEGAAKGAIRSKLCALSPQLENLFGKSIMTRYEVLNLLREYIAKKNLQDPDDSDSVNCDDKLHEVFGVKSVKASQMNKLLSKHLGAVKASERRKFRRQEKREAKNEAQKDPKKQKRTVTSGFLAPAPISETFMRFLGTGETELTRAEAIKRIWGHIKDYNLQDPLEKKMVICDEKLRELFGVDSFHGFTVSKLLSMHFVKP